VLKSAVLAYEITMRSWAGIKYPVYFAKTPGFKWTPVILHVLSQQLQWTFGLLNISMRTKYTQLLDPRVNIRPTQTNADKSLHAFLKCLIPYQWNCF